MYCSYQEKTNKSGIPVYVSENLKQTYVGELTCILSMKLKLTPLGFKGLIIHSKGTAADHYVNIKFRSMKLWA